MRARVRFSKLGKIRWTSHRDVARMWERAFRRVSLPLAYTQGFSPRPRVSFGLALPTGAESLAEYLDVELAPAVTGLDPTLSAQLTPALPMGIDVTVLREIDERADSLQEAVTSCTWTVDVGGAGSEDLTALVEQALRADTLPIARERKGRTTTEDVRPGILSCTVDGTMLTCELAAHPRTLRPSELLRALGPELEAVAVRRTHQWIERDGARWEPLPLDATDAPHAPEPVLVGGDEVHAL